MNAVRLRRLRADYEAVRRLVRLHPRIRIDGVHGNPPDRYRLKLFVRSLQERGGQVVPRSDHDLEVLLPQGYPRDAPLFRMLTPVFHPNIAPHAVCIGDHWTAGESLDILIQRVGEMLAFQSYNVKSPLNGQAAQWVTTNPQQIPTEPGEFFVDLSVEPAPSGEMRAVRCANCSSTGVDLRVCDREHTVCADCSMYCGHCGRLVCVKCGESRCACTDPVAAAAPAPVAPAPATGPRCANCASAGVELRQCERGHGVCGDCSMPCNRCGRLICIACGSVRCGVCAITG